MIFALKHNLGNLTRFSGRTGPKAFWLYVASLLLVYMGVLMATIASIVTRAAIAADFALFATVNAGMALLLVALLAASVTRRLHDSNRRGWWGLMPVPFLMIGVVVMAMEFGSTEARDMQIFMMMGINNLIYLGLLAVLVVLLAMKGTAGPNRFGEPPA